MKIYKICSRKAKMRKIIIIIYLSNRSRKTNFIKIK